MSHGIASDTSEREQKVRLTGNILKDTPFEKARENGHSIEDEAIYTSGETGLLVFEIDCPDKSKLTFYWQDTERNDHGSGRSTVYETGSLDSFVENISDLNESDFEYVQGDVSWQSGNGFGKIIQNIEKAVDETSNTEEEYLRDLVKFSNYLEDERQDLF